jgi:hypothetical protein
VYDECASSAAFHNQPFRNRVAVPKHDFKYLSEKQKAKARAQPPASSHPPPSYRPAVYTAPPSYELEQSLSPPSINFLKSLGNSATAVFLEADNRRQLEEQAEHATQVAAEREEERNYQAAIAASLGDTPPVSGPIPSSSRHVFTPLAPVRSQLSSFQPAIPRNLPPVETVPYEPTITRHLNPDWMRKTTDNTKKNMKVPRANPNNKFAIVFWGKVWFFLFFTCIDGCIY